MRLLLFIALVALPLVVNAQTVDTVTKSYHHQSLSSVLKDLEESFSIKIYSDPAWVEDKYVTVELRQNTIEESIRIILSKFDFDYEFIDSRSLVLFNKKINKHETETVTIEGIVTKANDGQPLPNVNITLPELKIGTYTNHEGFYSIDIPVGKHLFNFNSLEVIPNTFTKEVYQSETMNVEMYENVLQLDQVVIKGANPELNISETQAGKVVLPLESIRKLPTFFGEVDISKLITKLPGIQTVGEGATGFNVRGGAIDQNLVLMDGIPLYNSSHLLGFFSAFNSSMVQDFTIYKGNIPAQYGGKLSSVIDVGFKNALDDQFLLEGGIGPVTGKIFTQIPLSKGVSGVTLAGRYGFPNWVIRKIDDVDLSQTSASFYDLNLKYAQKISEKDLITTTAYYGYDDFNLTGDTVFDYSSKAALIKWIHYSPKSDFELSLYHSSYKAGFDDVTPGFEFRFENGITTNGGKIIVNKQLLQQLEASAGVSAKYAKYIIGKRIVSQNTSAIGELLLPEEKSLELAVFGEANYKLNNNIALTGGLRHVKFYAIGPSNQYVFNPTLSKSKYTVTDTVFVNDGDLLLLYQSLEPRVSINFRLNSSSSIKYSYSRNVQYENLYSNSTASLPTDVWKPVSKSVEPQVSDQWSGGYFKNFKSGKFETSLEVYYKNFIKANILRTGTDVLLNELLVSDILKGSGRSYGVELLIRKNAGILTGFASYAYTKTEFQVKNELRSESINKGEYFPADFDQPHNFNLAASFQLTRLFSISANFLYSSGRPVTLPSSSYTLDNKRIFNVEERNNFRIPPTHRLDISLTLEGSKKKNKRYESSFSLSVYNVYGRSNPFSVYTRAVNNSQPRAFQLSVIGTAVPSLTYNFKFR